MKGSFSSIQFSSKLSLHKRFLTCQTFTEVTLDSYFQAVLAHHAESVASPGDLYLENYLARWNCKPMQDCLEICHNWFCVYPD